MRNSVAVVLSLSAVGLASSVTNFTYNSASISATTRATWCTAQDNTCTTLCDDNPKTLTCDTTTLEYSCTCQNGSEPGLQYYTQTLYTFICNEAYSECIDANPNNATGQKECNTDIRDHCGTLDPSKYTAAASSSSSAPASTSTAAATSAASSAAATTTPTTTASASNAAPTMANFGNGAIAVAAGLFAYLL